MGWIKRRVYATPYAPQVRRVRCRRPGTSEALYETSDATAIAELEAALATSPSNGAYCMCIGTLIFDMEGGKEITLHHGISLRWKDSHGNHMLVRPDAVMDWLSARGMTFVREEYEEDERRRVESQKQEAQWLAALPASLKPFIDEMRQSGAGARPAWTAAVEAEFPDRVQRARAMLELFGSGVGPWSGYPSWEQVPQQLVLEEPFDVLFAAIGDDPNDRVCEGAARLFASWHFRKRKRELRSKISDELRLRLLVHVGTDPDKLRAVEGALDA
jgi:hypothetical protein